MTQKKITKKYIEELLIFTQDIAYEAGEILLKYQKHRQTLVIKDKGAEGIASEADEQSEDLILSAIREKYPTHCILSEEDYSTQISDGFSEAKKADMLWVVDPLDGTNNFVNGIPIYAVSIALMQKGKPVIGVVYNPISGECFFAGRGQGAFLVDYRINPLKRLQLKNKKNKKNLSECIFSPAPMYEITNKFERQISTFRKNIHGARAVRRLGSAALELCYVANGNFDGYWEKNLKPWDVAAAFLILEESGASITDFDGKAFAVFDDSILAACEPLLSSILGKIGPK